MVFFWYVQKQEGNLPMAIRVEKKRDLSCIKLICRSDDMIGDTEGYPEYLKSLDESVLKLKGEPTYLILNFQLKGRDTEAIKNSMIKGTDTEGNPTITLGSWQNAVARLTLKGIQNPSDMPLNDQVVWREKDGKPTDDVLGLLDRCGAIGDIFAAYQAQVLTPTKAEAKN
jgi:hypothetical protein